MAEHLFVCLLHSVSHSTPQMKSYQRADLFVTTHKMFVCLFTCLPCSILVCAFYCYLILFNTVSDNNSNRIRFTENHTLYLRWVSSLFSNVM